MHAWLLEWKGVAWLGELLAIIVEKRISGWCIVMILLHSIKDFNLHISYQHKGSWKVFSYFCEDGQRRVP